MIKTAWHSVFVFVAIIGISACRENTADNTKEAAKDSVSTAPVPAAIFNSDTAYSYVARQVAFGPRNPGSKGHQDCGTWLQGMLTAFCDTVYIQKATVIGGDKKSLPLLNLVGSIHPSAQRRILLLAHWDTRPWADQDTKDKDKPILAADDAGSGVAVLLELARALKSKPLTADLGVDIFLTDVEDYGKSEWGEDSYCLGTQYWARNPHVPGYKASYGILLDMVGARGSIFPKEQSSSQYAPDVHQKVWGAASHAGYSSFFPYASSQGGVVDDHKYVNDLAHIPTIDIIALTDATNTGFPAHWHTHNDNMQIIDKSTLQAVGQTLLQTLAEEGGNL